MSACSRRLRSFSCFAHSIDMPAASRTRSRYPNSYSCGEWAWMVLRRGSGRMRVSRGRKRKSLEASSSSERRVVFLWSLPEGEADRPASSPTHQATRRLFCRRISAFAQNAQILPIAVHAPALPPGDLGQQSGTLEIGKRSIHRRLRKPRQLHQARPREKGMRLKQFVQAKHRTRARALGGDPLAVGL